MTSARGKATPPGTGAPTPPPNEPAEQILAFWFAAGEAARDEWFRKDPAFDAAIRARFGAQVELALAGGFADWMDAPRSALARILLLDQFTRNIFRGSARAFAGDPLALAAARDAVARGWDLALPPVWRTFVYLPFEHAEDRVAQRESMRLFEALAAVHPPSADNLEWARRHQVIVERFGRFPHRNEILGRTSSPEEIEFLRQPGSRF